VNSDLVAILLTPCALRSGFLLPEKNQPSSNFLLAGGTKDAAVFLCFHRQIFSGLSTKSV